MNLDLRHKLTKSLIRLIKKEIKPINPTQPNSRLNALSSIGFDEIMGSIWLEFSQVEHVGLAWKKNETQPESADEHP